MTEVVLTGKNAPKKRSAKSATTDTNDGEDSAESGSSRSRPTARDLSDTAQHIQKRVMRQAQSYLGLYDAFPDADEVSLAQFLSGMYETTLTSMLDGMLGSYRQSLKFELNRYRMEPVTYGTYINKLVCSSCL